MLSYSDEHNPRLRCACQLLRISGVFYSIYEPGLRDAQWTRIVSASKITGKTLGNATVRMRRWYRPRPLQHA
jgi:hypothetical protein